MAWSVTSGLYVLHNQGVKCPCAVYLYAISTKHIFVATKIYHRPLTCNDFSSA